MIKNRTPYNTVNTTEEGVDGAEDSWKAWISIPWRPTPINFLEITLIAIVYVAINIESWDKWLIPGQTLMLVAHLMVFNHEFEFSPQTDFGLWRMHMSQSQVRRYRWWCNIALFFDLFALGRSANAAAGSNTSTATYLQFAVIAAITVLSLTRAVALVVNVRREKLTTSSHPERLLR